MKSTINPGMEKKGLRAHLFHLLQDSHWMLYSGLLALLCFSGMPNSYVRMVGWPYILIWQSGFFLIAAYCIGQLRKFKLPFQPLGYGLDPLLWAAAIVMLVSGGFATSRPLALWQILFFLGYSITLYSLRHHLRNGFDHRRLLFVLVLVGGVTSVMSLLLWRPRAAMWLSTNFYDALRNPMPLGHHNFVGGYFVLLTPLSIAFTLTQRGWRQKAMAALSGLSGFAIYASGSRGAWLGGMVVLVLAVFIAVLTTRGRQRRNVLLGAPVVGLLIFIVLFSNPRIRTMFRIYQAPTTSHDAAVVVLKDSPTKDRHFMIQAAGNILRDRPLLGVGPGNMARVYNLYRPIEAGEGLSHTQQLHNTPAQLTGELGLLGLGLYLATLGWILQLWVRLYRQLKPLADRYLLYGVGASLTGYGISSLTDYQLENIPIAGLLLVNLLLLLVLADRAGLQGQPQPLAMHLRRWLSLAVLLFMGVAIQLWGPFDVGVYLGQAARADLEANRLIDADAKLHKAMQLVPWDPVYSALGGQYLLQISEATTRPSDQDALHQAAVEYLRTTATIAPNDAWFNQNVAVSTLAMNPETSEQYAARAAQLLPRNNNYTYYLLALAYLAQNKTDAATTALYLQALVSPEFLTSNIWETPRLVSLKSVTLNRLLETYEDLLTQLGDGSSKSAGLYNRLVFLRWLDSRPLLSVESARLTPVLQGLLAIPDTLSNAPTDEMESASVDIELAIQRLNALIDTYPNQRALYLLRAWVQPDTLSDYLAAADLTPEEGRIVQENIQSKRNLRQWLLSTPLIPPEQRRLSIQFAYRNANANYAEDLLRPDYAATSALIDLFDLLPELPREFPLLDHHIERVRTEELGLPHPTQADFQLTPLALSEETTHVGE
ncbi:MAG: O-antigen ligase family protein [Cyanobacteria bacterium J06632_22]